MKEQMRDKERINHIIDAIAEIEKYLKGITKSIFLDNSDKKYATINQIEIISEACNSISAPFKIKHPEIA